jgi:hypothetical protein
MGKVIIALLITGLFCLTAVAKKPSASIAGISHRKKAAKDTVVMNFHVCKNNVGYTICGQAPTSGNSTYPLPAHKPEYTPDYEKDIAAIVLRGIPEIPKVKFPYDKLGPETQSGAFVGICSWNGAW